MRRVLILGGTGWLGREIARIAVADGAEVTCLARGESGPPPEGVHFVAADRTRPGVYEKLAGEWDEVVELAYEAELVQSALDALVKRARHWTLISTVSVYARNDEPGADESADLVEPDDPTDYSHAKVLAERATASALGDRLLVVRPGLIVGPGDPSDRFGYWPARLSRGGRALIPMTGDRYGQVIDVTDLATYVVQAGREGVTGTVNAVGESRPFADVLDEVVAATGFSEEFVTADDAFLRDHQVNYWAGPHSLPLWLPLADAAMAQRSGSAYVASGGTIRPLQETIALVLADEVSRGVDRQRRSGLTLHEEANLLDALGISRGS